jgi:hypothetical protein
VEELEPSHIFGRKVKWFTNFGKQFGSSLKDKYKVIIYPTILLLCIFPREMKTHVHTNISAQMFTVTLFVITKK